MLGDPTEFQGLIELAQSCGTHLQQRKAKKLYLVIPETQGKVLPTQGLGYRLAILVLRLGDALGMVGIKKTTKYQGLNLRGTYAND